MLNDTTDREIISTRIFNVSRETLFNAWINPHQLKNWWGPDGFTNTFNEFNPIPGGNWRFVMHGPDGADYKNECVFAAVKHPELIIINHISQPKFKLIATFEKLDHDKTKLVFRQVFETVSVYENVKHICIPANEQNLNRMETVLTNLD